MGETGSENWQKPTGAGWLEPQLRISPQTACCLFWILAATWSPDHLSSCVAFSLCFEGFPPNDPAWWEQVFDIFVPHKIWFDLQGGSSKHRNEVPVLERQKTHTHTHTHTRTRSNPWSKLEGVLKSLLSFSFRMEKLRHRPMTCSRSQRELVVNRHVEPRPPDSGFPTEL